MHIHILGICGTFMGGLAQLAKSAGHRVSGCDENVYPPMSDQLESAGIELLQGWAPRQIELNADVYVIGNVVRRGNPLMEAILDRGLRYTSGPQWLAEHLLADKWVLAIAGTHGKTTTSAMLAWILEACGHAPGFLIGGVPLNFDVSARLSPEPARDRRYFVIEADEYDTAFFDKRSKFVHYRPRTAIINNIEFDHADIFPDLAAIETQFHHLIRTIPSSGTIVAHAPEASVARVLDRGCWSRVERFGSNAGWDIASSTDPLKWGVINAGERLLTVRWNTPGVHNQRNALAAMVAASQIGVPPVEAANALASYAGVKRRLELRGTIRGIAVYDDFAHHPSAIAVTVEALASISSGQRILAVLEPRSNTMRLGVMKNRLAGSLAGADLVFCYAAQLDWNPTEALAPLGPRANVHHDLDQLFNAVVGSAKSGDRILVMSNGGFGGVHARILAALSLARETPP